MRQTGRWVSCVLTAALLGMVGCAKNESKRETPKPTVEVVNPVHRRVTDKEVFTGHLESPGWVQVRSRVTGYLQSADFKEGELVQANAVLFQIDPRLYEAEKARAAALLVQADARLTRLTQDYDRARELLPRGSITREEVDRIAGDRTEAEAVVGVARANLRLAELNLTYTRVTANQPGWIGRRLVEPGNLVKADETILAHVAALDKLYVHFDVDERTVLKIKKLLLEKKMKSYRDGPVTIRIGLSSDEVDTFPLTGEIDYADNSIAGSTGTLRVRGVVQNPDLLLAPGMFVRVQLDVGQPSNALLVPEEAIGADQDRKVVFVVNEVKDENEGVVQKVQAVAVKVGHSERGLAVVRKIKQKDGTFKTERNETRFCVVESADPKRALTKDDRVIVRGLQRVRDQVKVVPEMLPVEEVNSEVTPGAKQPTP